MHVRIAVPSFARATIHLFEQAVQSVNPVEHSYMLQNLLGSTASEEKRDSPGSNPETDARSLK
jgi:hypothetical protein